MFQAFNTGIEATPDTGLRVDDARRLVAGLDTTVPVCNGSRRPYVNVDNAATTPAFRPVVDCLARFQHHYSSVHRGTGFKSLLSTHVYEQASGIVADFVGAEPGYHSIIFTRNATHSLNKLARRLPLGDKDVVVTTEMEHHSNMLPWRQRPCRTVFARVRPEDGALDLEHLGALLRRHTPDVKVVAVTGASNVTGSMPPVRRIARMAHEAGAWFVLDATQLVAHRPVRMGAPDDPERFDFLAFSGHKMYAPFGCGVLIGPREVFERGAPDEVGGGTVHAVTLEEVIWHKVPEKEEAGTPNVNGAVALARAARVLQAMGMEEIAAHEREMTRHCLERLLEIDGLRLFGRSDVGPTADRNPVFAVEAGDLEHGLLAAALGYEWGIGVRNGCFCAQPYVRALLGIPRDEMRGIVRRLAAGDHTTVPGLVRISLGVYNTREEVDYVAEALRALLTHGPRLEYRLDPEHLDYVPINADVDYDAYSPF